jgi:hypothetical protein
VTAARTRSDFDLRKRLANQWSGSLGRWRGRRPSDHTARTSNDRAGSAIGLVADATAFECPQLPVERDRCALVAVVSLTQRLTVHHVGLAASAVRVNVICFQELGLRASAADPAVVLASPTSGRQHDGLVRTRESSYRIADVAWVSNRMDYSHHRQGQERKDSSGGPWR